MSKQRNRGQNSNDDQLFGGDLMQHKIKQAVADMQYLLSRGFAEKSSLQLVGNRYRLNVRQQKAVQGMSASTEQLHRRQKHELSYEQLKSGTIIIDGFNLLIILESALSGAYLFKGLDNAYRDLSGVHGTYKRVQQTEKALRLVGDLLLKHHVIWVFDQPVSNSGRLKTLLRETAKKYDFQWDVILDNNPDKRLAESEHVVVSSDAWVLDRCAKWLNLGKLLIESHIDTSLIIEPQ
ncbi:MAG: DUF434 domain-containing protein [Algicola sp.]|nr:DUF434 domain-containing protein [Algicola sp.]